MHHWNIDILFIITSCAMCHVMNRLLLYGCSRVVLYLYIASEAEDSSECSKCSIGLHLSLFIILLISSVSVPKSWVWEPFLSFASPTCGKIEGAQDLLWPYVASSLLVSTMAHTCLSIAGGWDLYPLRSHHLQGWEVLSTSEFQPHSISLAPKQWGKELAFSCFLNHPVKSPNRA